MINWYFNPIPICHLFSQKANLLYGLKQKKTLLSSKFFKPPPLSLFLLFLKFAKKQTLFFSLPVCYLSPSLRRRQPTPNIVVYSLFHGKHLRFQSPLALVPSLPSFPKPRVMFLVLFFFFFF
jgi:hypothetical protein